jgi:D-lactate dehydrogenase (cytochrome)
VTGKLSTRLVDIVGAENVIDDATERAFYAHDVAGPAEQLPQFVACPRNVDALAACVAAITDSGCALVVRGGGHSYTGGYGPTQPNTVILDLSALDKIVAINETDRWVTVEAGCTWSTLYDALAGPLSGIVSTIGGAASQNAAFFGSARHGPMSSTVLGLDIVTADGTVMRLGAAGALAYARDFGPDAVGLFLGDCGALGVKARITMRLIPAPAVTRFASYAFESFDALLAAQIALSDMDDVADSFGFDTETHENLRRSGFTVGERAGALSDVARADGGLVRGLKTALKTAATAHGALTDIRNSLHLVIESPNDPAADAAGAEIARRAQSHGGAPMPDTIPRVTRSRPFRPLKSLLGPDGEAWLPLHGLLPLSQARPAAAAIDKFLDDHKADLAEHNIRVTQLTTAVGDRLLLEPQFFWPDSLSPFHQRAVTDRQQSQHGAQPPNERAREHVHEMRASLTRVLAEHGATHYQIGKYYPYRSRIDAGHRSVLEAVKHSVDPKGLLNPGVLGF